MKKLCPVLICLLAGTELRADTASSASPAYRFENTSGSFFTAEDDAQEIPTIHSEHEGNEKAGQRIRQLDTDLTPSNDSNRTRRNRLYVKEEHRRKISLDQGSIDT